jgi:hypothetical protein
MEVKKIIVNDIEIKIKEVYNDDYICLTDIAKGFGNADLVKDWIRNKNVIEFLGIWENLNNEEFKGGEFATFKSEAGTNRFHLTPKHWIEKTNAKGIITKAGKYDSGTYAQKDIALHFCSWISPEFQLYIIREFQRLKKEESERNNLDWNFQRVLSKLNYRILLTL